MKDKFLTLAIETSCDETSAAVLEGGRKVLSNIISSQIDIHKVYGGVVPEIASRHHLENINKVIKLALNEAKTELEDIDLIGVTKGPGLVGALLVGIATAKALALSLNKPLVGVHHLKGHISSNFIQYPDLEPPFLSLIVSGGHTGLVEVSDYNCCRLWGSTRDDAVGEAYDKVARVLGLGYPGGPKIDKLARRGRKDAIAFKRVYLEKESYDFSFSGIKTGVLNYVNSRKQEGLPYNEADLAAGFQEAVLEVLVNKTVKAAKQSGYRKIAVAGGVGANSRLRELLADACKKEGFRLYIPTPVLCTDNAAMIGSAAYYLYRKGIEDDLTLDAYANLDLEADK